MYFVCEVLFNVCFGKENEALAMTQRAQRVQRAAGALLSVNGGTAGLFWYDTALETPGGRLGKEILICES